MQAVRDGDFSVRLPGDWTGLDGKIADTFNEIVAANASMARELERVGTVVGKQGKTRQRVQFGSPAGAWGEMEASVNTLIDDLLLADDRGDARARGRRARATCCRPCGSTSTAGRSRASSCARRPSSTR